MSYGSNFVAINFAWNVPENETATVNDYESSHAKAILIITQEISENFERFENF